MSEEPFDPDSQLITGDLRNFFSDLLVEVADQNRFSISPQAISYVTEILVNFHATAELFTQKGVRVPVLADMLSEALEADFHRRVSILRKMGDTSLMVSGFFPEALNRRAINLNYYQKMGEIAYSHLGGMSEEKNIFDELSDSFVRLSSMLHGVAEQTHLRPDSLEKSLELYWNTESPHALEKLKQKGIIPFRKKSEKLF